MRWPSLTILISLFVSTTTLADGFHVTHYSLSDVREGSRNFMIQIRVEALPDEMSGISGIVERTVSWGKGREQSESFAKGSRHTFALRNRQPRAVRGKWRALSLYWNGISPDPALVGASVILIPAVGPGSEFEIAALTPSMERKLAIFGSFDPGPAVEDYAARPRSKLEPDLTDRDLMALAYAALRTNGAVAHELILRYAGGPADRGLLRLHLRLLATSQRPAFFEALSRHICTNGLDLDRYTRYLDRDHLPQFYTAAFAVGGKAYTLTEPRAATSFVVQVCQKAKLVPLEVELHLLESLEPPLDKGEHSELAVDNVVDCILRAPRTRPESLPGIKALLARRFPQWKPLLGANRCDRVDDLLGTSACRE